MTDTSGASGRKRVVLHVGLPKTGTTAFQDSLALNHALLDANGLRVGQKTDVGESFRRAIRNIVRKGPTWLRRMRLDRAAREIRDWVDAQPADTVLITDENLLGWRIRDMYRMCYADGPAHAVAALDKALAGHRISWVLTRREAQAHMRSAYRYFVKLRGVSSDYDAWAREIGTPEALERLVDETAAALGDACLVLDMSVERARSGPWGAAILSHAGLDSDVIAQMQPGPVTNMGLPDDLLPYVRRINAIGLEKSDRHKAVDVMLSLYSDLTGTASREVFGTVANRAYDRL